MTPLTESLLQKYLIIKTAEAGLNALLARLNQVEYEQTCENYCKSIKEANELRIDIDEARALIADIARCDKVNENT